MIPPALAAPTALKILVLFHSKTAGTLKIAREIAAGIESVQNAKAVLKRTPPLDPVNEDLFQGIPIASPSELSDYDGIAFGSPVYFGNVSSSLSHFMEGTLDLWTAKSLVNIPGTVFISAGSGRGKELASTSFSNTLASHGMIVVPDSVDPHQQGRSLATVAQGMKKVRLNPQSAALSSSENPGTVPRVKTYPPLPKAPQPVGDYRTSVISGNLIFINQISIKDGKVLFPGRVGEPVSLKEAKAATRQTALNVLAVLKEALGGDLDRVVRCVQLTGFFNTAPGFKNHALIMNEASTVMKEFFGASGSHARATIGASSLPLDSVVEIQSVFEIKN